MPEVTIDGVRYVPATTIPPAPQRAVLTAVAELVELVELGNLYGWPKGRGPMGCISRALEVLAPDIHAVAVEDTHAAARAVEALMAAGASDDGNPALVWHTEGHPDHGTWVLALHVDRREYFPARPRPSRVRWIAGRYTEDSGAPALLYPGCLDIWEVLQWAALPVPLAFTCTDGNSDTHKEAPDELG